MIPIQNKIKFPGINSTLISILSIVLVLAVSNAILDASAQTIEYSLKVKSTPSIIFIGGGGFYTQGSSVTVDKAPETWREYTFVGWQIDGTWADGNPITIRMDSAHTLTAVYSKEIGGTILVDAIPRISEITVDGTIYLPSELPVSFTWPEGSTHVISSPAIISDSPDTRYVFDSWKDNSIDKDRTVTISPDTQEFIALFKTQHYLKPITDNGIVEGGGWKDEGKTAFFDLESDIVYDKKNDNIRYVFESWDTGDYQNSISNSIDILGPAKVKATWTPQYKLDLTTSVPEYDLFGFGWYEEQKQIALIADEELESSSANIRYVFDKWVSKGPNPVIIPNAHSPSTTITIEEPYVIEAVYKESYRVNVWSQYGSPAGAGFYKSGEIAEISVGQDKIIVSPNKERKVFSGWNTFGAKTMNPGGTLSSPGSTVAQNLLVLVDKPLNITTNWKTQYYLDVQSQEGRVKGAGWYDLGRMVPFSVDQANTPPGMWSVVVFDKWTGDVASDKTSDRIILSCPTEISAISPDL